MTRLLVTRIDEWGAATVRHPDGSEHRHALELESGDLGTWALRLSEPLAADEAPGRRWPGPGALVEVRNLGVLEHPGILQGPHVGEVVRVGWRGVVRARKTAQWTICLVAFDRGDSWVKAAHLAIIG